VAISGGNPLINKLGALIAIILGFLLAAEGYRSESTWLLFFGVVVLAIGLIILVRKVVRRNEAL
jgi:hypothetical protein